ncbi:MAG TPA: LamG-like jellyroll fold domain-containing protein [Vicinamibacterales bacterium]|jgi:hypothetical protein|nr:LamG-like jellyroll fold domain-containing protein [Vicinamibacterales bacterium]
MIASSRSAKRSVCPYFVVIMIAVLWVPVLRAQTVAPSTYSFYTGTDAKPAPPPPVLGPANTVITDPTFGSTILRVTDQNTFGGQSFIPGDSGFVRTFNANSTAIKLIGPQGQGYWLEFNPATLKVGDGSSHPVPHDLTSIIPYTWEWSAVNPDIIYFLNGNTIAKYNKATGAITNLGGPLNGDPATYHAAVVGQDQWVCSAAGAGIQDTFTKLFCIDPNNPSNSKLIDVPNKTINGVAQSDPHWPTSAAGQTLGVHSIDGSAGGAWLGVTFHQQSWGGNGDCVFNLATNTWSLLTGADPYWSGHVSLGNGKSMNGSGSIDGRDSRGAVVRDPNDLMNSSKYVFIAQPPTTVNWYDGEHSSWHNAASNPNAPVLFSRYGDTSPSWLPWLLEIVLAATDGSNTVWRVAHSHGDPAGCYYAEGFAQISNDGNWALFSSYWGGTLGSESGGFGCGSRIDTFIVKLSSAGTSLPTVSITAPLAGSTLTGLTTVSATASDNVGVASVQFLLDGATLGPLLTTAPYAFAWTPASALNGLHTLTAVARNTAGNSATSSSVAVTVAILTPPPVISAVAASGIWASGATIAWTTDKLSDSQVDYGPTTGYGSSTTLNAALATSHSQALSGLSANTVYHYRVKSRDAASNLATSGDSTFTTAASSTPVGYWPFDEGTGTIANDASGNGHVGALVNGPAWTAGRINLALSFNGVSNYVSVADAPALDAFPLTIAAWINTTATTGIRGIVNKYAPGSFNGYQIFMNNGALCAWYLRDAANYAYDGGSCTLQTPGYNDGKWHQVVYVVDSAGGRLFVDGTQTASLAWTGSAGPTTTTQPLHIGDYPGVTGGAYFTGVIDEVRIYNGALSPPTRPLKLAIAN